MEYEIVCTHDGKSWYQFPWSARCGRPGARDSVEAMSCMTKWGAVREVKHEIKREKKQKGRTEVVRWKR